MTDALYLAEFGEARPGEVVELIGDEGRHAAVVKRTRVGEVVLVADGRGRAVRGPVTEVTKQGISVLVDERLSTPARPHRWTAVQALAKGDRSEVAVESLTELGASRIIAWQASRSVARWVARPGEAGKVDKGVAKWQATARESTKQSRRFTVPEVSFAITDDVLRLIAAAAVAVVCHEDATLPLARVPLPTSGEVLIVVGPEGGISPDELAAFTGAGAVAVSLGDGVLRTSSAAVVALAQLQVLAELQQTAADRPVAANQPK